MSALAVQVWFREREGGTGNVGMILLVRYEAPPKPTKWTSGPGRTMAAGEAAQIIAIVPRRTCMNGAWGEFSEFLLQKSGGRQTFTIVCGVSEAL